MNVIDPILFQCRSSAPAAALCAPGTGYSLVSYGRLGRFIHNVARKGSQLGLLSGRIVGLFISDPVLHAAIALGLTRLGVATFSGRSPDLPKELRVDAVVTDNIPFPHPTAQVLKADSSWIAGDGTPLDGDKIKPVMADDLCRIVLTSGTTGEPRAVGLSHRMLADRIARHFVIMGRKLPQCSRTYCDLGLGTSLGFQFLIYILWRGGTFVFPGDNIAQNLHTFETYKVQNMVTAPSQIAQYLQHFENYRSLQCSVETILSGGSLLVQSLSERVRAMMCADLIAAYGSTETSMVATAPAHALADTSGAVGHILPGMAVEIVDNAGKALPTGAEGAVRIRGPYSVNGYLGSPPESAIAFRDGWFYPGDIGRLTRDGLLAITGREKTIVNIGGDKLKPESVEAVVSSFAGVNEAGVLGVANELGIEEVWALVVPRGKFDEEALRAHCRTNLPETFAPVRFIVVDSLPHNEMGKIERRRLPDIARAKLN